MAILALARGIATTPERRVPLDLVGTISAVGLGLVVFGILRSGAWRFVQPMPGAPGWLGLSPAIWLTLGGGFVLWLFLAWESRLLARGGEPLVNPAILRNPTLRGGLTSFFFQYSCKLACSSLCPCFSQWRLASRRSKRELLARCSSPRSARRSRYWP
jgi:hypothetical protein